MTVDKEKSVLDETEFRQLEGAVADVERLIAAGQGTPTLMIFRDGAKQRLESLREEIATGDGKREKDTATAVAVAAAVAREAALNAQEKQAYGGFLQKEFFTKRDFNSLDEFYSQSWDKLSEPGKTEMEHRVWEGIRKEEYKFSELPESVRERSADRVYKGLVANDTNVVDDSNIPEKDKQDFMRAFRSGNNREAHKLLDRDSFTNNVAVKSFADGESLSKNSNRSTTVAVETSSTASKQTVGEQDLVSINLDKLTMVDVPEKISSADIPHNSSAAQPNRSDTARGDR